MTPEEIQKTLEGMVKIQKELQQTQINLQQTQITQSEEIKNLIEQGKEQDRRIQQLVGYSISQAGEVLDVDGVTGGFNLQSAWTTGWLAGKAIGNKQ